MTTIGDNIKCKVCGGNEFTKDAGFYYCIECQTQTHELREHELEFEETLIGTRTTKTTVSRSEGDSKSISGVTTTSKKSPKLTSWEVYNFILAGVINEIIGLGGSVELNDVAKSIWFYYLRKLGIMYDLGDSRKPKLGLQNRKNDAAIVYGVKFKRKRRKSYASSSSLSDFKDDLRSLNRERSKRRRAMVHAEYQSQEQSIRDANKSLENAALSELQSSDSDSSTKPSKPKYNRKASFCMKKLKSQKFRQYSTVYKMSPYHLTRTKIYAIASLSCFLCYEDRWLPSDIIRACQQGFISYLDYSHMLPVDVNRCDLMPSMRGPKACPSHKVLRKCIKQIAGLIEIDSRLFQPNLVNLIARYCSELNLPDEIKNMALNLFNEIQPNFGNKKSQLIPNFEGRAMSYILFVLKVVFGLDNKTEFIQSEFSKKLNKKSSENNFFVFGDWLNFLHYRTLILKNFNFPYSFFENNQNLKLFVTFLIQQRENSDFNNQDLRVKFLEKFLGDLEISEGTNFHSTLNFEHNIRLFSNFFETIKKQNLKIEDQTLQEKFFQNFSSQNLDNIFHYKKFLKELYGENYSVLRKSAHKNQIFVDLNFENLGSQKFGTLGALENPNLKNTDNTKSDVQSNFENSKSQKGPLESISQNLSPQKSKKNYEKWLDNFEKNKLDYHFTPELENFVLQKKLRPDSSKNIILGSQEPKILVSQVLSNNNNKDKLGRAKNGRFCKKNSKEDRKDQNFHNQRKRGPYFISSWVPNPKLEEKICNTLYVHTGGENLIEFGKKLIANKIAPQKEHLTYSKKRHLDFEQEYFEYFLPHNEYWVLGNLLSNKNWKILEKILPRSFWFVLGEFSKICGQTPRCLFEQFFLLETYILFEHFKYPINNKDLQKILLEIHKNW